jgi:hypothetical protein
MLSPTSEEILQKLQEIFVVAISQFDLSSSKKEEGDHAERFKTSYSELKILKFQLEQGISQEPLSFSVLSVFTGECLFLERTAVVSAARHLKAMIPKAISSGSVVLISIFASF